MFNNVLGPPDVFTKGIELVKEGEEWKFSIPTTKVWDTGVSNFLAKHKAYHTGLHQFTIDMGNGATIPQASSTGRSSTSCAALPDSEVAICPGPGTGVPGLS